jgi:hypothetical protein
VEKAEMSRRPSSDLRWREGHLLPLRARLSGES